MTSRILNDPDAMALGEKTIIQQTFNTAPLFPAQQKLLNLFCLSLINHANSSTEAALYALIKFVMYTQKFAKIDDAALGELEQVYAALLEQLQTGVLAQELMNIAPDSKVKTSWYCRCRTISARSRLVVAVLSSITISSVFCGC